MNKNHWLVAMLTALVCLMGSTSVYADSRDRTYRDRDRDRDESSESRRDREDRRDREETETPEDPPAAEPPPADPPPPETSEVTPPSPASPPVNDPPPDVAGPPDETPAPDPDNGNGNENPAPTPGEGHVMVTLCHVPPKEPHSITVAEPSVVQAHLAHGDTLGGCDNEMAAPAAGTGSVIVICRPGGGGSGHQLSVSPVGRVSHIRVSCD